MNKFLVLLFFFFYTSISAQELRPMESWQEMLENGEHRKALDEIQDYTQDQINSGKYDSLPDYLVLYGRILRANFPKVPADEKLYSIHKSWKNLATSPTFQRRLAKSLANWYEFSGDNTSAYAQTLEALNWASQESPVQQVVLSGLYLNLGGLAVKNMDLPAAKVHLGQVLSMGYSEQDPENVYFANSFLGNIAYFTSNLDSAGYFYQKTLEAIDLLEPNPRNQFYRKSIIFNNLAGVQMAQSDFDAAEESMNQTILFREKYMATDLDALEYQKVLRDYLSSLDNLAGLYKQLGQYSRAKQLLEYSFRRKSEELGEDDLNTTKSRILLGQIYFDLQELDLARKYLQEGLSRLEQSSQEGAYWRGDGLHTMARMEDFLQNENMAESLYREAKAIFDEEFQGEYDVIYLDFLKNFSRFLAENQQTEEAISLSGVARNYLAAIGSNNLYLDFNQMVNQAAIFELGTQYAKALEMSDEALELWDRLVSQRTSLRDSLQAVYQKPQIILIRNRSRYHLGEVDPDLLKSIEKELLEGLQIIDSQSDFLFEPTDINIQLDINQSYFEFLEKIELELYRLSKNEIYLDRLLAYHEHARYRQIRSRLQKNQQVRYGRIPQELQQREKNFREKLDESLSGGAKDMTYFSRVNQEWIGFLDTLRIKYPNYFQLHFETSENALQRVYTQLDPEITYLRYLRIGDDWLVVVIKGKEKILIPLDSETLTPTLEKYALQASHNNVQPALYHGLYQLLWQPVLPFLQTQRMGIIPDGTLFSLSFEALSKNPINNWSELKDHALLRDYSFSYQYGLLLLDKQDAYPMEQQLVAFAPGFFDEMKRSYQESFSDGQFVDKSYLELIPQPFTRKLVDEISTRFGAKAFLEAGSTIDNFKMEAGKSRIIHLGTHAVSSNVNPNDSRLVFAKSSIHPLEPHELFASEIYDLDLSSELAVLLACESGKSTYAPGEGMISLAHAFNYAGTRAMLIGLGKIDERASVQIAEEFYRFLEQGMGKDEALREAKLNFLSQAKGRELAPPFWSGLIILGNPDPVVLEAKKTDWYIFLGVAFLLLASAWLFKKKYSRPNDDR